MIGGAVLSYAGGSKETLRRRVPARGAGTHQGRSRQGRARQTACHAGVYREKLDQAVQIQRRGGGGRRYDWETKVAAARDHVENGMTKTEAMARHGIASIVDWQRCVRRFLRGQVLVR